jgi:6-phospho-beta-glucosidase
MRLTIIGGSGASTPELMDAVVAWPGSEERRPPFDIVLQGRSAEKLALVAEACEARLGGSAREVRILAEPSLDRALRGADIVLIQARVGGLDARIHDETFPRAFGLPGEETMGPGGFANALRTVPAMTATWERIAEVAGDAFIVNLTNPSGIVTQAATAHTGVRFVSVCDGPASFVHSIARETGRDADDVRLAYSGMNHCGFWVDADPQAMRTALPATSGIDAQDVDALGALPTAYVRFYLHPQRQLEAQLGAPESRAQALKRMEGEMLGQYAAHVAAPEQTRRGAIWYGLSIVPLIDAVASGGTAAMVLGLPNQGAVGWAPEDAIVELPTDVLAGGATRRRPAVELPAPVRDLLSRHAEYEARTARALAGARSREDVRTRRPQLVEALAVQPMLQGDTGLAGQLVDAILERSPA